MTVDGRLPDRNHIRTMFGRIAPTYDTANRVITFGRDRAWRRYVVEAACLSPGGRVLDIGCGTGDIAYQVCRQVQNAFVVAADFSAEMLRQGMGDKKQAPIRWCLSDASRLPFRDSCFDTVFSGYLVRNVPDVSAVFREQRRVVKPGGRLVCLETCPPPGGVPGLPVRLYMRFLIPFAGWIISGDRTAYRYLQESSSRFMEPGLMASVMEEAGLVHRYFRRFMFGTQVVHVAERP